MNEYKFLKSIDDNQQHKPKNPDLYDQDNEEVQLILKLEKQGLVKYHVDFLESGNCYWNYRDSFRSVYSSLARA